MGGDAIGLVRSYGPPSHLTSQAGLTGSPLAEYKPTALVSRPTDMGLEGGHGELRNELTIDFHRGWDMDHPILDRWEVFEILPASPDVCLDPGI